MTRGEKKFWYCNCSVTFSWNTEEKGLFSGRKRERMEIIIIDRRGNDLT